MLDFIVVITLIYMGLIFWFASALSRTNRKHDIDEVPSLVSVIIAARNESDNLAGLCAALQRQTYPADKFEIIIVDDRSADGTGEVIKMWQQELPNLRRLQIAKPKKGWAPKKWALSNAISESLGEIILLTDADCAPDPLWIHSMVDGFSDPQVGVISGPAPLTEKSGFLDSLYEMESLAQDAFSAGAMNRDIILSCTGRNLAYRRKVYNEVQGFSGIESILSGDDDLLLQKIAANTSWEIRFRAVPGMVVSSPPPGTLQDFIRQRLRFASKGLHYYHLPSSLSMKLILPFLYLVNLLIIYSLLMFVDSAAPVWLLPLLLKSAADAWITYSFYTSISRTWSLGAFAVLMVLHPFYVVIFGTLGPLVKTDWKGSR